MRPSRNVIEQTWLAYAFQRQADDVEARLARVERHYSPLIADRVEAARSGDGWTGLVLWRRVDPRLRWPLWTDDGGLAMATTAVPTGWRRLLGDGGTTDAPPRLARALSEAPDRAADLNPPFVIGLRERDGGLMIVNDLLGGGRLYEMRFGDGWVWSNRLAALPLFAGVAPQADEESWATFAAAGWFLGKTTPIRGAGKVPPASVVRVSRSAGGTDVTRRETDAQRRAVEPRRARIRRSAEAAADQVLGMAEDLGAAWEVPIAISLTGGRDSRVSAAAAIAAGIDATFNTGDQVPGEVDVVRKLVDVAPRPMDHTIYRPEPEEAAEDDLWQRIRAIHLVHDGMRNPQEVRRPTEVPQTQTPRPTLSGHGGELGHGFYYTSKRKLNRLRRGGDEAILDQLERNARRRHSAASEEAYALYLAECDRTLERGRAYGLKGPVLLDWFYMSQRLPYRSGIGARSGRSSACVAPAFVRGAFDLSPKDRLTAKLHRETVARLVPQWRQVPFFRSDDAEPMPELHRQRLWERSEEAAVLDEMIATPESWSGMLERERIEEMWREVRSGGGSADYEHVFYRLVWRAGYEVHLRELARELQPGSRAAG